MVGAITRSWALLLGIDVLLVGNGLSATELGVRASIEHFPTALTGVVQAFYYAGFFAWLAVVHLGVGPVAQCGLSRAVPTTRGSPQKTAMIWPASAHLSVVVLSVGVYGSTSSVSGRSAIACLSVSRLIRRRAGAIRRRPPLGDECWGRRSTSSG